MQPLAVSPALGLLPPTYNPKSNAQPVATTRLQQRLVAGGRRSGDHTTKMERYKQVEPFLASVGGCLRHDGMAHNC